MKQNKKYDPEDLNKLLQTKSYDQLLQEEKVFVNEHIDSADDYMKMRSLMLDLENQEWESTPDPNPRVKEFLIRKHRSQRKGAMKIWLNGLFGFTSPEVSWYKRPAMQLVMASGLILITVVTLVQINSNQNTLALVNDKTEQSDQERVANSPKEQRMPIEPSQNIEQDNVDLVDSDSDNDNLIEIKKNESVEVGEGNAIDIKPNAVVTTHTLKDEYIDQVTETVITIEELENSTEESAESINLDNNNYAEESNRSLAEEIPQESKIQTDNYFLDMDIESDDLSEINAIEDDADISLEEEISATPESIKEISVSSTRGKFKKRKEIILDPALSVTLAEQGKVIDQLFEAY